MATERPMLRAPSCACSSVPCAEEGSRGAAWSLRGFPGTLRDLSSPRPIFLSYDTRSFSRSAFAELVGFVGPARGSRRDSTLPSYSDADPKRTLNLVLPPRAPLSLATAVGNPRKRRREGVQNERAHAL